MDAPARGRRGMVKMEPHDIRFFATPAELRDWFDANHLTEDELWLGYYKKASGRPSVDWAQVVDECLCPQTARIRGPGGTVRVAALTQRQQAGDHGAGEQHGSDAEQNA